MFDHVQATGSVQATGYTFMFLAELAAMLVELLRSVRWSVKIAGRSTPLVHQCCWIEAPYVGLGRCAPDASRAGWYLSVPRIALLWWPLWTALTVRSLRRPRFRSVISAWSRS
ncbi:hypothetical protein [Streptomyces sp. CT34]|uniref:hypothetical protein n=1 Tax=Streptomyces sp. CT34 TaxID=1553907 RepID=UPI0005B9CD64|nr:hypothetical protein [Streptomyces sp. CT34]